MLVTFYSEVLLIDSKSRQIPQPPNHLWKKRNPPLMLQASKGKQGSRGKERKERIEKRKNKGKERRRKEKKTEKNEKRKHTKNKQNKKNEANQEEQAKQEEQEEKRSAKRWEKMRERIDQVLTESAKVNLPIVSHGSQTEASS